MNIFTKGLLSILMLLAMTSCGGGGSDVAGGGIGGTGISQGPISGFGSVIVNGVKFEDTGAAIEIEDVPNSRRADLKVGMVVKVAWQRDAAGIYTATSIVYGDDVQGPAVDIDTANNAFTVLGQPVVVNPASTVFEGAPGLAALAVGTVVEVSGLRDSTGAIHATRIEVKAGETEFELKGIASVASAGTTFTLGSAAAAVVVSYSGIPAVPAGACVEVKSTAGLNGAGQLVATGVELDDDCAPGGTAGQTLEVKGYPSAITVSTFTVNGQQVSYSSTVLPPGTNLSSAVIIEVEGTLNGGVLVASKISFEIESTQEGKGVAVGPVDANGTLTVNLSEPSVESKMFTVNNVTVYEDSTDAMTNFGRAGIGAGQTLKVYFYLDATSNIATRIKREN